MVAGRHGGKRVHRSRFRAYLHLWGIYYRYWRNSGFRAKPDFQSRSVYRCGAQPFPHFHVGRRPKVPDEH